MRNELNPRGRPRSTRPSPPCARCHAETGKIRVRWPDGQICGRCFTTAVRTYDTCASCGDTRLVPGRSADGSKICVDCAGITTNLRCDRCGREAERYSHGLCARCVVTDDLVTLLRPNNPPDMRLKRLIKVLAAAERPESIYTWLRTRDGTSAQLLRRIGDREIALSHEAFDVLPKTPAVEHLRAILVHNRILPAQDDRQLAIFEQWLTERLKLLSVSPEIQQPIERFARWHHLKRLRAESSTSKNMNYAVRSAKQEITETGKFLAWLADAHGATLSTLKQQHLDEYLSEGPSTRFHIRNFFQWLKRAEPQRNFHVAYRVAIDRPMITQQDRLDYIKRIIEADNVSLSPRIAGLLFLL
jgi:hypothetical protein